MCVMEEPPQERMPIQTFVMEYNDEIVRDAINRELARGGQVYFVYNRVQDIADMAGDVYKRQVRYKFSKFSETVSNVI